MNDLVATVDALPSGVVHLDLEGSLLLANSRFSEMLGRSRDELLGWPIHQLAIHGDFPSLSDLTSGAVGVEGVASRRDVRFVRRDGSVVRTRLTITPGRDAEGDSTFLVGIVEVAPEQDGPAHDVEQLRAALEAARTGTYRWDIAANRIDWDDNLDRLLGIEPGGAPRSLDRFIASVAPADRPRVLEALWLAADEGPELEEAFRVDWPDGSVHWILDKGETVRDSKGLPLYMTGACIEITSRVEAERQVRESEARLRALIQASPLAIAILGLDGRPILRNPRADELHGIDLGQAGAGGWTQNVHPEDRDRVIESMYAAGRERRDWRDTYRLVHPDGRVVWVSGRAAPMEVDGEHVGFVGTLEDVTPLKEAETAVRESESKLRRITDSGMIGVFYWNASGEITDANDEFLRMLGFDRKDLKAGRLHRQLLTPARWLPLDQAKMKEVITNGVASAWEKELYTKDGRTIPVLVAQALLDGATDRGIAICMDVSERREAELERDRLLTREHEARAEAERAIRLREEVLAVVAHDLRNPVGAIAMSASTMLNLDMNEAERARQLNIIQRAATGMDNLISDLLDVSRIEAGSFAIRRRRTDVTPMLGEVIDLFGSQAKARRIRLVAEIPDDLPPASCDRDRLAQAVSNLISNAIRFSPPGDAVTVRARHADGQLEVSVMDNGPGVAAADQPHIFDRFWQVDRTSRAGAGLGLAIAKGIVESHGGRIWVESAPGQATRFCFTVPL